MRVSLSLALVAAVLLHAVPARADLWAYVDESGRSHFADHQVDARYSLFFKGPTNLDVKPVPPRSQPSFEGAAATIRDRVADHPNLERFGSLIERHARSRGLDPALVKAMIAVESAFEPTAVSPKGAIGLMQVIPDTAARYGLASDRKRSVEQKLKDPAINVSIGTRYLADLIDRFDDVRLALAAYNAGEGAVERYDRRVPPFPETQAYVILVEQFRSLYTPPPPPPPRPSRVVVPRPGAKLP